MKAVYWRSYSFILCSKLRIRVLSGWNLIEWSYRRSERKTKSNIFTVNYSHQDLSLYKVSSRKSKASFSAIPERSTRQLLYEYLKNTICQQCQSLGTNSLRVCMITVKPIFRQNMSSIGECHLRWFPCEIMLNLKSKPCFWWKHCRLCKILPLNPQ